MGRKPFALTLMAIFACRAPTPSAQLPIDAPEPSQQIPLFGGEHTRIFSAHVHNLSATEALAVVDAPIAQYVTHMYVFRTNDAGQTWRMVLEADGTFGEWASSGEQIWLASHIQRAGVTPELRHSSDGGRHWTQVDVERLIAQPESVVKYSGLQVDGEGIAMTRNGVWLRSSDNGENWQQAAESDSAITEIKTTPCRVVSGDEVLSVECMDGEHWKAVGQYTRFRP